MDLFTACGCFEDNSIAMAKIHASLYKELMQTNFEVARGKLILVCLFRVQSRGAKISSNKSRCQTPCAALLISAKPRETADVQKETMCLWL